MDCTSDLGTVSHSYQLGNHGNSPQIQVLRCQLRANLANRIFKDSSLRPIMLTFFLSTQYINQVSLLDRRKNFQMKMEIHVKYEILLPEDFNKSHAFE